jgi:hypothetical protein
MANSLLRALTSGQPPGAQELHGLQASECTVSEHALRETTFSTESVPECHVQLKFGQLTFHGTGKQTPAFSNRLRAVGSRCGGHGSSQDVVGRSK